jgi:hypothetical protein
MSYCRIFRGDHNSSRWAKRTEKKCRTIEGEIKRAVLLQK